MQPAATDLILIGVLPHPRDLEIARLLGWYRIPLRTAPKLLMVDYLAFYQPAAFGEVGGRIEYFAPVLGHELTTRGELLRSEPQHPRAREEYFKLQLGSLERLPAAIPALKWRRFAFLYSTGAYLAAAKSLDDLVIQAEDRPVVWQAMRERALGAARYAVVDWPELPDVSVLAELLSFPISSS